MYGSSFLIADNCPGPLHCSYKNPMIAADWIVSSPLPTWLVLVFYRIHLSSGGSFIR